MGELLAEKPTASIRAIAKEAGVSPSTVHEVRQRLRTGQDVALKRQKVQRSLATPQPADVCPLRGSSGDSGSVGSVDIATILASLKGDPSLRFSDAGRSVLRWLERYRVGMTMSIKIAEMIPDHCATSVAKVGTRVRASVDRDRGTVIKKIDSLDRTSSE